VKKDDVAYQLLYPNKLDKLELFEFTTLDAEKVINRMNERGW
jgi:hypothetical protein